jgi:pimeloyl-ACP methyl ester carboxylesterase
MPVIKTPSGRISYSLTEPDNGAQDPSTVLMIMGLGGSGAMWWRLVPHVAQLHRAIVFDNRGTGASSPVHAPLSMADLAGDAVAVLDHAGVQQADVIGASMGGMIAQHLALDHRDRFVPWCSPAPRRGAGGRLRTSACSVQRCCGDRPP